MKESRARAILAEAVLTARELATPLTGSNRARLYYMLKNTLAILVLEVLLVYTVYLLYSFLGLYAPAPSGAQSVEGYCSPTVLGFLQIIGVTITIVITIIALLTQRVIALYPIKYIMRVAPPDYPLRLVPRGLGLRVGRGSRGGEHSVAEYYERVFLRGLGERGELALRPTMISEGLGLMLLLFSLTLLPLTSGLVVCLPLVTAMLLVLALLVLPFINYLYQPMLNTMIVALTGYSYIDTDRESLFSIILATLLTILSAHDIIVSCSRPPVAGLSLLSVLATLIAGVSAIISLLIITDKATMLLGKSATGSLVERLLDFVGYRKQSLVSVSIDYALILLRGGLEEEDSRVHGEIAGMIAVTAISIATLQVRIVEELAASSVSGTAAWRSGIRDAFQNIDTLLLHASRKLLYRISSAQEESEPLGAPLETGRTLYSQPFYGEPVNSAERLAVDAATHTVYMNLVFLLEFLDRLGLIDPVKAREAAQNLLRVGSVLEESADVLSSMARPVEYRRTDFLLFYTLGA